MDYQDTFRGEATIEAIIFRNEENGYSVLEVSTEDALFTAVGTSLPVAPGEVVYLEGTWANHPQYGRQIKLTLLRPMLPQSTEQMRLFLGSGIVKGCGPGFAQAIVDYFGEDTHQVLLGDPARLTQVPKIGMATAIKITDSYRENVHIRENVSALMEYGLTVNQALKIGAHYGQNALNILLENPYQLAEDITGIGFRIADAIAQKVGIEEHSPFRIAAALRYALTWAGDEGHTYLPAQVLVDTTYKLIGAPQQDITLQLAQMVSTHQLILGQGEEEPVFLPMYYHTELECANRLYQLYTQGKKPLITTLTLSSLEKSNGITLAPEQENALTTALENGISVITGGPGTGKTTIVKFLIQMMQSAGLRCALCAPTGRAAKRMGEATDTDASTIHRLLEYSGGEERPRFHRDQDNPLQADVIIVDETSMVDIFLFMRLLRAIPPEARLVLIGDADQLPSVGPGNVLKDIIHTHKIPTVPLTTVYRQGEGSGISINAHRVNRGEMPQPGDEGDFIFLERNNPRDCWDTIRDLLDKNVDLQIIAPQKKGEMGVINLNLHAQALLNPPHPLKPETEINGTLYRQGDRVMQTKNNYEQKWWRDVGSRLEEGTGVFNGEMGVLTKLDLSLREATITFDDDRVSAYPLFDLVEMDTSYAISIHKSQGSEFDGVIIPLLGSNPLLYTKNLLYTAITRARRRAYLVGSTRAVSYMVKNDRQQTKYSGLLSAILEVFV
ncbi:ATP-dependent RecD-like DNA helicase [Eubacteriales bacterium OttesenSCG-928-M02]|nr:ATP-dependent RecD-like DNA helicase [Eubacteriales bacterium OttesenSCG-928-M02]